MVVGWAPRWTRQTERTSLLTLGDEQITSQGGGLVIDLSDLLLLSL